MGRPLASVDRHRQHHRVDAGAEDLRRRAGRGGARQQHGDAERPRGHSVVQRGADSFSDLSRVSTLSRFGGTSDAGRP